MSKKKTYFISDLHLGVEARLTSKERESLLLRWLDGIAADAEALYLVGDVFDFWHEYKTAVPKGYVRFLGKLAQLRDAGIPIYMFTGNHDIWMYGYFEEELGIPVYRTTQNITIHGKHFLVGHGDGLGPGDLNYKRMKKVFTNPLCQWAFRWVHPDIGIGLANYFSQKSRKVTKSSKKKFVGAENNWHVLYANRKIDEGHPADFFVFGHHHLPIDYLLKNQRSRYINLGDWLHHQSYAVFDGEVMQLKFFENEPRIFSNHLQGEDVILI